LSNQTFDVVFAGRAAPGADPEQVRARLAKLFNVDTERVDALFGKRTTIKKGVDAATAKKYQAALTAAGAVAEVVGVGEPPAPAPAAQTDMDEKRPAAPQAPNLTVAEPGVILVETKAAKTPSYDTSQFTLADVGVDLIERKQVPAPQYDLSGMSLDPPGVLLTQPSKPPPADYDTSALGLVER
jgi:hypothetical protein